MHFQGKVKSQSKQTVILTFEIKKKRLEGEHDKIWQRTSRRFRAELVLLFCGYCLSLVFVAGVFICWQKISIQYKWERDIFPVFLPQFLSNKVCLTDCKCREKLTEDFPLEMCQTHSINAKPISLPDITI